ncbi:MAG: type VII toxin-antitoxin system HepT family RNase toxin [bacterium]
MVLGSDIVKRIERIEEALRRLEEIKKLSVDQFLSDWKSQDAALHNLQITIEGCLDIGNYIIGLIGSKSPDTYVQIIEILGEEKVLPKDFWETAKNMAKFRNIIVHEYLYLDLNKVYSFLLKTDDIRQFLKYLIEYLETK